MTADFPEEPGALKGHARIRGGESQQWLIYPTNLHAGFRPGGGGVTLPPTGPTTLMPSGGSRPSRRMAGSAVRGRRNGR